MSTGIISKTNLNFKEDNMNIGNDILSVSTGEFFMTDAAINGGNSGGPVFNKNSELVGIVESKLTNKIDLNKPGNIDSIEGMGFAISVTTLNKFINSFGSQYQL